MKKFPLIIVALLMTSFVFGGGTALVMYATGQSIAYTPKMMMVSHTEYRFGEAGQIIARIVDFQGNPVAVDSCNATILYPDKTTFVSFAGMSPSLNISADYYYSFTNPAGPEGTYEYQATCFYGVNKNASVTNSFHLSGVTNTILGNLTEIDTTLTYVQGNLTQLSSDLFSVNASLAGQVSALSSQLNANTSTILANFATIQSNFTTVYTELDNIDATLASNFATIQSNFSSVLAAIAAIDNTMVLGNLTEIDAYLAQVLGNQTEIDTSISGVSSQITDFRAVYAGNVTAQNAMLSLINDTTTNTYNYVTGTLATNVNSVLTQIGVINATVNRIETTTGQINTTVNSILQNQQDQVYMSVTSG